MNKNNITDYESWQKQLRSCDVCGLAHTRQNVVCGEGSPGATIALIGEAPGREEDKSGFPFAGKAGSILNEFLADSGIRRESLYIGNTVKCRPVAMGKKGYINRKPSKEEIAACRPHLEAEMRFIRPLLVVTLGAVPLAAFCGFNPVMRDMHGQPFFSTDFNVEVFPLYHPAAIIYDPEKRVEYETDMLKLKHKLQITKYK